MLLNQGRISKGQLQTLHPEDSGEKGGGKGDTRKVQGFRPLADLEPLETDLRRQFNEILREQGMKAALAWREARLDKDG